MSMTTGFEVECKGCGARFPLGVDHDCRPTRAEYRELERRITDLERAMSGQPIQPWPGETEE